MKRKPLVLCKSQVQQFKWARGMSAIPHELIVLSQCNSDVESWLMGVRAALSLALDCLEERRYAGEGCTYGMIARRIADSVFERRGPEITEHDDHSRSVETFDEVEIDEDE